MKIGNVILFVSLVVISFAVGLVVFSGAWKTFPLPHTFFEHKDIVQHTSLSLKEQQTLSCTTDDKGCADNNEKIKAAKLTGETVEFAKHQCDGPRPCPAPDEKTNTNAIQAIRTHAKQPKLDLVRVTGINQAGILYYCAKDRRFWSYELKTNKFVFYKATPTSIFSPTPEDVQSM
jgi:hypothetical protein